MATASKRTLWIELNLRNALTKPLGLAGRTIQLFGRGAVGSLKGVASQVVSLKGLFVSLTAALAVGRMTAFVRATADQADELGKLAKSTGDSVENLSELQAAFELDNVKDFNATIRALTQAQAKALTGNDKLAESFARLGINLDDLRNLGPSELFEKLAVGLGELDTEQERSVALASILKKQFLDLLPILGNGAEAFRKSIQAVRADGVTITEEQTRLSDDLGDAFTKVGFAVEATGREIITAFGPQATELLTRLAGFIRENRGEIVALAQTIAGALARAFNVVLESVAGLLGAIDKIPGVGFTATRVAELEEEAKLQEAIAKDAAEYIAFLRDQDRSISERTGLTKESTKELQAYGRTLDEATKRVAGLRDELMTLRVTPNIGDRLLGTRDEIAAALEKVRVDIEQVGQNSTSNPADGFPALGLPSLDAVKAYAEDALSTARSVFRSTKGKPRLGDPDDPAAEPVAAVAGDERGNASGRQRFAELTQNTKLLAELKATADSVELNELFTSGAISAHEMADGIAAVNEQFRQTQELSATDDFFGGFQRGIQSSLDAWRNFTAAGAEAGQTLLDNGLNGLTDAMADIITGAKSAKDAFKDFAVAILGDIAKIIAKLVVMQALNTLFPALAKGGTTPGVASTEPARAFARGGVARRPTLALFGEGGAEAFVPLPDGQRIPVVMSGGGGGGGSVVINITAMDSKDVQRALLEQRGTLRSVWNNDLQTRTRTRQNVRKAAS